MCPDILRRLLKKTKYYFAELNQINFVYIKDYAITCEYTGMSAVPDPWLSDSSLSKSSTVSMN